MKFVLLRENYQKAKAILKKREFDINDPKFIKISNLVGKHRGYLGKFTEWHFEQGTSLDYLKSILEQILEVGLDKQIDTFKTAEDLGDYLTKANYEIKTKQVINSLPSRTRNLVNKKIRSLIFNFPQHIPSVKDFYSKKGGRHKTSDELYKGTETLIKNLEGGWSVDSIKYKDSELVYKDSSTLILHISRYKRSKILGSVHWCISTSKQDWFIYTDNFNKQYFIYDFSKEPSDKTCMIGVTINTNGEIWASHYRDDTEGNENDIISEYGDYLLPYSRDYFKNKIDIDSITEVSKYGLLGEVKRLLDSGVDPSVNNNEAIRKASENGHTEVVKVLLADNRVDPSVRDNEAIREASYKDHSEIVKVLLADDRVDPSADNNKAIRWASYYGHSEVVKVLLADDRVDPSADNNKAIVGASENGHLEVVVLLLADDRVDPSARDNDAIWWASENNHIEVVKILLADSRVKKSLLKDKYDEYDSMI